MSRAFFILSLVFSFNLPASNLPDCSGRPFDPDRIIVVMKKPKSSSAMQVIRILSTIQHQRWVANALFPIFQDDEMKINVRFSRYYEPDVKKIVNEALLAIVGIEGTEVLCTLYRPGET